MENKVLKIILGMLIGSTGILANQVQELDGKSFYTAEKKEQQKSKEPEKTQAREAPCLSPYGIKLGQTTISEMKKKFKLLRKEKGALGQIYHFDPLDFSVGDLQVAYVQAYTINDGDTVENLEIVFNGKQYAKLKKSLSKSYEITYTKEPFVGNKECDFCQSGNHDQFLFVVEPHMSFETMLGYRTKKFNDLRNEYITKEKQQQNIDIESKL